MLLRQTDSIVLLIDVQEKLIPYIAEKENLIVRCQWIMNLANRLMIPLIVSEQYPSGLSHTVPSLAVLNQNTVIEKVSFSCYREDKFKDYLHHFRKKQCVLIGIETHVCVLQTAIDLLAAQFEVFIVIDAVSSRSSLDHQYGLKRLKQAGAQLVTSEMVFFEWVEKAGTPYFKALSKEFLR